MKSDDEVKEARRKLKRAIRKGIPKKIKRAKRKWREAKNQCR